jgi:alkanesulfonate monooxygenase SsuD/methylene tetrahydromethanopterin reductase-like flavin-dependent oxidoreductase (luciferase family)
MLPAGGPAADPAAIRELARTAEAMGYASVWAAERALFPQGPTSCAQFLSPVSFADLAPHDPLALLAEAADATERIGLRVSILNVPFHSPALLVRNLAALDERSRGRVGLGLGLGFTDEECRAVSGNLQGQTPAAEFLRALRVLWTREAPAFHGEYFYIPQAHSIARGVQSPALPMTFVAFAAPAVLPSATLLTGTLGEVSAIAAQTHLCGALREIAEAAERSPDHLPLALRAAVLVTAQPLGPERAVFHGTLEQIASDLAIAAAQGVKELIVDFSGSPDGDDLLRLQARLGQLYALAANVVSRQEIAA